MTKKKPPSSSDAHLLLANPAFMGASATERWANPLFPGADMGGLAMEMHRAADRVKAGDLSDIESMLVSQAMALQIMFANLSRRAASQEHWAGFQGLTGMALKTQAACRQTLEALAELKNPRTMVVAQQANVAHQQINHQAPTEKGREMSPALEIPSVAQAASPTLENDLDPYGLPKTKAVKGLPPDDTPMEDPLMGSG